MTVRAIAMIRGRDRAISVLGPDSKEGIVHSISEDLKRFKELTKGCVVVVGRKTFEEMGSRCLPERETWLLTSRESLQADAALRVFNTVNELRRAVVAEQRDVWVIGGEQVYRALLPWCREVYLTVVKQHRVDSRLAVAKFPLEIDRCREVWDPRTRQVRGSHHGKCRITASDCKVNFIVVRM